MGNRVGVELLFNSVEFESKRQLPVEFQTARDQMWKRKPHPTEGALGNPDGVWGPEKMLIRCKKESQHPAVGPRPPVEQH